MRETIRDFMIGVGMVAALFAAFQSWATARDLEAVRAGIAADLEAVRSDLAGDLAAVRSDLAEVRGELRATADTVIAHVNAPGLHGPD